MLSNVFFPDQINNWVAYLQSLEGGLQEKEQADQMGQQVKKIISVGTLWGQMGLTQPMGVTFQILQSKECCIHQTVQNVRHLSQKMITIGFIDQNMFSRCWYGFNIFPIVMYRADER
jgi:hypothetical protein